MTKLEEHEKLNTVKTFTSSKHLEVCREPPTLFYIALCPLYTREMKMKLLREGKKNVCCVEHDSPADDPGQRQACSLF